MAVAAVILGNFLIVIAIIHFHAVIHTFIYFTAQYSLVLSASGFSLVPTLFCSIRSVSIGLATATPVCHILLSFLIFLKSKPFYFVNNNIDGLVYAMLSDILFVVASLPTCRTTTTKRWWWSRTLQDLSLFFSTKYISLFFLLIGPTEFSFSTLQHQ